MKDKERAYGKSGCPFQTAYSAGFGNSRHADIDFRNFVPGGIVGHAGLGQIENPLKNADGFRRCGAVNAVSCESGYCRIVACNAVQLVLQLSDLVAGGTDAEIVAGPGGGHTGDKVGRIDIHIISKIIADDFDGGIALVTQILRAPLA